jgi:GWxTD domain-containing protein
MNSYYFYNFEKRYGKTMKILIFLFITLIIFPVESAFSQYKSGQSVSLLAAGYNFLRESNLTEAEKTFDMIPDDDINGIKAMIGLAKVYYADNDFFKARNMFLKALKKDTANIELNYYAAIGLRENGRYNGKHYQYKIAFDDESFKKAEARFKWIFNRDSLYRDAMYQYSVLLRAKSKYIEAIEANLRQIRINPEIPDAYSGLNRTFFSVCKNMDHEDLTKYLNSRQDDYLQYLLAELKRYEGKNEEALDILDKLESSGKLRPILINISRLKTYAQQDSTYRFKISYNNTIAGIKNKTDASIFFDDIKYIASKNEIKIFLSITNPEYWRNYFYSFWNRRNPTPVHAANPRIIEHYKRLKAAQKDNGYDREILNFTESFDSYALNYDYTDQGLIYIKHGKPQLINKSGFAPEIPVVLDSAEEKEVNPIQKENLAMLKSMQSLVMKGKSEADVINESWLYREKEDSPKMIFHFAGLTRYLIPIFLDTKILDDIRTWDSKYDNLFKSIDKDQGEIQGIANDLIKDGEAIMTTGLESERTTHNADEESITLTLLDEISTFKGSKGYAKVEMVYLVPTTKIFSKVPEKLDSIPVECGYGIFDMNWNELYKKIDTILITRKKDSKEDILRFVKSEVKADSAGISVFFQPLGRKIFGNNKKNINIPDYSKKVLNMSDIQVASKIERGAKKSWFSKNDLTVVPSPSTRLSLKDKLNIYYEIYNLTKNSDGKTIFQIEYILRFPKADENLLTSLFSKSKDLSTSTEYERVGKDSDQVEFISFDVNKLEPGKYTLEIKIKDINGRKTITRTKNVELY